MSGEGSLEARIAELVAQACEEMLTSLDGVISVDWNDLGEVTLVVVPDPSEQFLTSTLRLTVEDITGRNV